MAAASDRFVEMALYRCTRAAPPRPANQGVASGDRVAYRWVPLASFPFPEIPKNRFPCKKYVYKVRKNLRKFLKVVNKIWNTFYH
jgi:hypothetical protein